MARFWWGNTYDFRGIHWVSWAKLCQPKSMGGMGFRSLKEFNQALIAKQVWRLLKNPSSLAGRVLQARYFPSCSILEASIGRNPSYLWRSLCWGREVIRYGYIWRVGNGMNIRIYKDPWLENEGSLKILTPQTDPSIEMVADLLTDSGSWNINLLQSLFSTQEVDIIKNLQTGGRFQEDRMAWHYQTSGTYNVKSGYWVAWRMDGGSSMGSSSTLGSHCWWKFIWKLSVPRKVQLFLWRACIGALPTYAALVKKKTIGGNLCAICDTNVESILHALWFCRNAKSVWQEESFYKILKRGAFGSFIDLCSWAIQNLSSFDRDRFALLTWAVWNRRNVILHGHPFRADKLLLNGVVQLQLDFYEASSSIGSASAHLSVPKLWPCWRLPDPGTFKINVDGGVGKERVEIGVVIRNEEGAVMAALAKPLGQQLSPLSTELYAIKEALLFCLETGFTCGIVESDSQQAIGMLEGVNFCLDSNCFIIEEIRFLLLSYAFKCSFVRREANSVAHQLAQFSLSLDHYQVWLEEVPYWLSKSVQDDLCNTFEV